jgi:hypothetical protein
VSSPIRTSAEGRWGPSLNGFNFGVGCIGIVLDDDYTQYIGRNYIVKRWVGISSLILFHLPLSPPRPLSPGNLYGRCPNSTIAGAKQIQAVHAPGTDVVVALRESPNEGIAGSRSSGRRTCPEVFLKSCPTALLASHPVRVCSR